MNKRPHQDHANPTTWMAQSATCLVFLLAAATATAGGADTNRSFKKQQLTDKYWAEGAVIADIDRDGHQDIVSGPFWYAGPSFKNRYEIAPATQTFTTQNA